VFIAGFNLLPLVYFGGEMAESASQEDLTQFSVAQFWWN
jgi:hypothetical protein